MTTTATDVPSRGHADHVQAADERGLTGDMPRPIKVTMLGAGSMFTPELTADLLQIPRNLGGEIVLVDIDENRLDQMRRVVQAMVDGQGNDTWTISSTIDRRDALPGSHYIVNCIEVSGVECVRHDNDIPLKYGVDQCIGDTVGPGGLMKGLRTIPVWLEILRDVEELCPEAWVLNYTNPMGMMCLAAHRSSSATVVGLCHSVQATSRVLAWRAGVRYRDLVWDCAGINHLAWFTRLESAGIDLYPALMEKARQDLAGSPASPEDPGDLVRKDVMVRFGAFVSESSGHFSEYVPYYRTSPEALAPYGGEGYDGESGFYAREWPGWRVANDTLRAKLIADGSSRLGKRTWEYASWIIEAREKDQPYRIHGNVPNRQVGGDLLIPNLPSDGIVEVATFIDRAGVHPTRQPNLAPQLAALCQANMAMIGLGAQAAIERRFDLATWALMVDPLTAACATPAQIESMASELFEAEAAFLPGFT